MTKIVKKETGAVKVVDMSMFESDAGKGMGEIGLADLSVSYLVLLSGGKDLDAAKAINEAANKGDFFNKGTGTVYKGSDGIDVIPCAYQRRFVRWTPLGAGSKAPLASFTQHEQRPETAKRKKSKEEPEDYKDYVVGCPQGSYLAETFYWYVFVVKEDGTFERAVIAMYSTQIKKSKLWNNMVSGLMLVGEDGPFNPPRYSHIYHLSSVQEQNTKGNWSGWGISRVGPVTDTSHYVQAKSFSESIYSDEVTIDHSQENDEVADSNDVPF